MSDSHDFGNLGYPTLAQLIQEGPAKVRKLVVDGGHDNIPITEKEFKIEAGSVKKVEVITTIRAEKGSLFFHKKRGTKVTIIEPNIGTSGSGDRIHLVIESRTGHEFRALEKNLELSKSI